MIEEYIRQVEKFTTIVPKTILEIGALDGEYSSILQKNFSVKNEDTYLVEPNPDLFQQLSNQFPGVNIINKAIGDKDSMVSFYKVVSAKKDMVGCSSMRERIDGWNRNLNYATIEVPAITGHSLIAQINRPIDLCIIDVEGMAYEVLSGFESRIDSIKTLMIECEHSEIFKNQKLFNEVEDLLTSRGYSLMAFRYSYASQSDSVWVQQQYVDLAYKFWPVEQ
jgi:FkbM family methyltransferase